MPTLAGSRRSKVLNLRWRGTALDRHEATDPWSVAAIRLLILTGGRLSEVVNLKWDEIGERSEDGSTARLAVSKTGPRTIWLGPPSTCFRGKVNVQNV